MKRYFPLVLILIMQGISCLAQKMHSDWKEVTYHGNKFVLKPQKVMDTVYVANKVTGNVEAQVVNAPPFPITMNGKGIADASQVMLVSQDKTRRPAEEKILDRLKQGVRLSTLPDGVLKLHLRKIVVDEKGKIVYSDYSSFTFTGKDGKIKSVGLPGVDVLFKNAREPLGTYQGRKVPYAEQLNFSRYIIEVSNHAITYHAAR